MNACLPKPQTPVHPGGIILIGSEGEGADAFTEMVKAPEFTEFAKKADVVINYKTSAETKAFLEGYIQKLEKDFKYMQANK